MRPFSAVVAALAAALYLLPATARADDAAKAEIAAALETWRGDFNARRSGAICDLFAPELRYDFRGLPEQTYEQLCERLQRALSDTSRSFHYELTLKEIIVSGDLAVVRLTWHSTLTAADGTRDSEDEPGLDVFRRGPDGRWKIIRYIAYSDGS